MIMKLASAGALCLGALILSACVSQQQYDAAAAENQKPQGATGGVAGRAEICRGR